MTCGRQGIPPPKGNLCSEAAAGAGEGRWVREVVVDTFRNAPDSSRAETENRGGRWGADVLRVMPSKAIELAAFDGFKRLFARVPLSLPHEGGPNYRLQSVPQQDRTVGPSATMMAGALAGTTHPSPSPPGTHTHGHRGAPP